MRTFARIMTCLAALLLLAPSLAAAPAGTRVVVDPRGDVSALALDADAADLLGAWFDSDGTDWTVTFQVVDLSMDQAPTEYRVETVVQGSGAIVAAQCVVGAGLSYCTAGPVEYVGGVPTWKNTVRVVDAEPVAHGVDEATDLLTVVVPYGVVGVAAGDEVEDTVVSTHLPDGTDPAHPDPVLLDFAYAGPSYVFV